MSDCPYCRERPCETDDHIFLKFLGGRKTIGSCKDCNDRFGHGFEASVSKELIPIIVCLTFSGLTTKKRVVYKRAWVDPESGYEYDIDSKRQSTITDPHLTKDVDGTIRGHLRTRREAKKLVRSLEKKGTGKEFNVREVTKQLQPPLKDLSIKIGPEMRQLAVKMCAALARLLVPREDVLDSECRQFLHSDGPARPPVRSFFHRYANLDALRPALAHTVYVEGDPASGRCYGVVQLFGVFQFYAPLHAAYAGSPFAAFGLLDVASGREEFQLGEPLRLQEPPQHTPLPDYVNGLAQWADEFNRQTRQAFGEATIVFGTGKKHALQGIRLLIPLLWIEYTAAMEFELELAPDRVNEVDLTIATAPQRWTFSPDFGLNRLPVFETFTAKWNGQAIDRTLGVDHIYVPEEVRPGTRFLLGENHWCPVQSFRMRYRVVPQAWLGNVQMSECSGILEQVEHCSESRVTLKAEGIPMRRDPSWPVVADIGEIQARFENLIVVECWDLNPERLVVGGMGIVG
jgi:hypothetical protein